LVLGDALAFCALCLVGVVAYLKDADDAGNDGAASKPASHPSLARELETGQQAPYTPPFWRKVVICFSGGVLLGAQNFGTMNATSRASCAMSPYSNQIFFSVGAFACTLLLLPLIILRPVEGGPAGDVKELLTEYRKTTLRDHLLALLGGFGLCMGFFFYNLALPMLGGAPTYAIGQSCPLVVILWGVLYFKEFAGASTKVCVLVLVEIVFFIAGVVVLAMAS